VSCLTCLISFLISLIIYCTFLKKRCRIAVSRLLSDPEPQLVRPTVCIDIELSVTKTCTDQGYPFHPFLTERPGVNSTLSREASHLSSSCEVASFLRCCRAFPRLASTSGHKSGRTFLSTSALNQMFRLSIRDPTLFDVFFVFISLSRSPQSL